MQLIGRKSITFRLTLLFAGVSTTVLLLLGLLVASLVERHFEEQDMYLLTGKLELVQHTLEKAHSHQDLADMPMQLNDSLVGHHGLEVLVLSGMGQVLFSNGAVEFPEDLLQPKTWTAPRRPAVWTTSKHERLRGISILARTGIKGDAPSVLVVATAISHHEDFMSSFRTTLWSVMGLAALLSGFLGWIAVRRGLAPLQAIKQGARGVTAHRLDYRLAVDSVPIELAELAQTLNDMLARLEESFQKLSDFSSDLAHELRTPVSNLLTQTQVTLSKLRQANEYQDVLASNAEELERMARMISDMLFLAQAENGLIVPAQEEVDLAAEVGELFEFYEALAEERQISLSREGEGLVNGDRLMLRRAISNLLSNAIRHTPPGGWIKARIIRLENGETRLSINNSGPPIPAEHLPRLFDRFYRAEASRQRASDGAGLGLAITRSILTAHGGEIEARSEADANVFEMRLPPSVTRPLTGQVISGSGPSR
ncbi:heavy metal sensor histidine kinase [Denitratisoma oestradiolicum]|uniref:Sensor protein n=1 Tax=Denitratisoma oestradiolicum TaxID=311182 RepID=A0A6S6XSA4_9PROT|nr:heavy metal sensor histidine kinase [Denitratisoma oestradiolicum]TWO81957.1 two-component sensor histidine kinase [Denitratisoma oestradiolicum]CAB1368861.1 putative sensor protein PcoS [Denitratisoma oestradiolicum]